MSFTAYSPLFDMVIYPAVCGIVVVVVVTDVPAISVTEEEMIFDLVNATTETLDAQDKKENE